MKSEGEGNADAMVHFVGDVVVVLCCCDAGRLRLLCCCVLWVVVEVPKKSIVILAIDQLSFGIDGSTLCISVGPTTWR